ncbi:TCP-1/cpn60 chaperonin family protein [Halomarina pelagica]|uniref:TCP-1/cpn60 chaperonin family protein n=1 Tax=Halomarina pelagica TaxID=2961599 RepID=UPI0020C453CE|nr:TCP-1/cpn60 chaperonin family protein [Halomarina sp. BND7]
MAENARATLTADARTVCDLVRTTLGPFGANKLVIGTDGTVTTTASGSLVLDSLELDNPAVRLLKGAASDFRNAHGDGSSTVVALTGALLDEADRLSELGLHPTTIERGYREALGVAVDRLERSARPLEAVGVDAVARTALTGTRNPNTRAQVGGYVERVAATLDADDGFDADRVAVRSRLGGAEAETELVAGVVLDRDPVTDDMPRTLDDAGVAVLSTTVDVPRLGGATGRLNAGIRITPETFEDRAALGETERERFRERLDAALDAGCRVVVTGRSINERVERTLANAGILALQRVDEGDLRRIARATGATVVPGLDQVTTEAVGRANVRVTRRAGRDVTSFESVGEERAPVYTLFCRAPDARSVEAFERSVESALAAVDHACRTRTVVPGGGAAETGATLAVREHARSVPGTEQLAIEAFGDALAVVPRALAVNAGIDGWRGLVRLRVAHHEGRDAVGVDCLFGETRDVLAEDPIAEPTGLKREVWSAATDLAVHLVRMDAELPASDLSDDEPAGREERR